ncbi:MAG: PqqD family protein [Planctomycetota bacterium]
MKAVSNRAAASPPRAFGKLPGAVGLEAMLRAVPVRNAAVREGKRGGAVVLWVPVRRRWWSAWPGLRRLPWRGERGVALDALGREVWSACDGVADLEAIAAGFAQRHGLTFHEARLAVTRFLRMLAGRGLLVVVGRGEPT